MQSVVVAVDRVSQFNTLCVNCKTEKEDYFSQHLCEVCGTPQPIAVQEDYFTAFGVSRFFSQDRKELERRFYRLSKALHPDRFTMANPAAKDFSLKRISFINQAYGVLKSPDRLREYLLTVEHLGENQKKNLIPFEWTESWFEIQDLMSEDPVAAQKKIMTFRDELKSFRQKVEKAIASLEEKYDLTLSREVLEEISDKMQTQNYLKSLEVDVERMSKNAYSN
jgi:DnaJ-domain-containing protein 1